MLNAFRHHSEGHAKSPGEAWEKLGTCSTPSGITARATGAVIRVDLGVLLVLNAFRHHSEGHPRYPFQCNHPLCAQRLPASQRGPPVAWF